MKKIVSLLLMASILLLPGNGGVYADETDNLTNLPIATTTEEWLAIKQINSFRVSNGLAPLATTENMHLASETRASELVYLFARDRPDGTVPSTILDSLSIEYDVFEQCIFEKSNSATKVVSTWLADQTGARNDLLNEAYSILGLANENDNAWALFLVGTREFISVEVANQGASGNNYVQGTEAQDFAQFLKLDAGDGQDYYMPIVSEMVSGYNSQTLGTQNIVIHFSDALYTSMDVNITEGNEEEPEPDEYIEYTDVDPNSWYADAIQYVSSAGLFEGTSDTEFSPEVNLTRAMFVTVLGRLSEKLGESTTGYSSSFSDVKYGSWYYEYVSWAAKKGIVEGYNSTTFGPDDNITREQMAVLFERYSQYIGAELNDDTEITFTDAALISTWAVDAVRKSSASGLINGDPGGTFRPQDAAIRAEVAVIFQRFLALPTFS